MFFFSTYFSKAGGKSDIISFMVCYINTYRTKLFPYLKNIDSNFMKLISRYRFESLDITLFLVQLKLILSKPGLKKARKASQFSKR